MDLGSLSFSVCLMMVCLLGAARLSSGDNNNCSCPAVPQWPLTEPPPETCFEINKFFRYKCVDGYLRKAGTSNRIQCLKTNSVSYWTTPDLKCISGPKRTTTQPPSSTATKSPRDSPRDSIITTTATATSTSPQRAPSASTSASVAGETNSEEPTPHGDSVTQHTVKARKIQASTFPPSTADNYSNSPPEAHNEPAKASTVAIICCASLAIVCALIGVGLVMYRRRSKNNASQQPADELMPMNHAAPGQAA